MKYLKYNKYNTINTIGYNINNYKKNALIYKYFDKV